MDVTDTSRDQFANLDAILPAPQDFAARSAQLDRDLLASARNIAAAKTTEDIRAAITSAYPFHAATLAATADESVYAYANGVMAEVIRELANLAERQINRNG